MRRISRRVTSRQTAWQNAWHVLRPSHGSRPTARVKAPALAKAADSSADSDNSETLRQVVLVTSLMGVGVGNRLLYKLALVPLGGFVFFLAQSLTVAYMFVYGTTLFLRYKQGILTEKQLTFAKSRWWYFVAAGALDTASQLLGLLGAVQLPGVLLPLFQQTFLLWQLLFNWLLLGRRFSVVQLLGVAGVVAGVSMAAISTQSSAPGSVLAQGVPLLPAALFLASCIPPALVSVIKDRLFTEAREALDGKQLDIFVVNTSASCAQAVSTLAALPLLARVQGIDSLPTYLADGARAFAGVASQGGGGGGGQGAPWLPLAYICTNLGLNVLMLMLLRERGSVTASLAMAPVVPLTVAAFALVHLPLLPPSPPLQPQFFAGVALLFAGLLLYNAKGWLPAVKQRLLPDRT